MLPAYDLAVAFKGFMGVLKDVEAICFLRK